MHVLVVAPFDSGFGYITAAKKLEMRVSVIAGSHEGLAIPEAYKENIDYLATAPDSESATFVRIAQDIHKVNPIDAVVAGIEFYVEATAEIAHALGLPGLDPKRVKVVRNKALMRQCLADAHIRIPQFARVASAVDLEQVARDARFPVVIKPLQMAASIGVARADNAIGLLAAYEDIQTEKVDALGFTPDSEVLVEEMLVGTQYAVNGYVAIDGSITSCELFKVEFGSPPYFQEIGHTTYRPQDLPESKDLIDYTESVVRAVGINAGPFHAEVRLTEDGPVLIEIAARLPGDHMPYMAEATTGINLASCTLAALLGQKVPMPAEPMAVVAANQYIVAPELAGQPYRRLEGLEAIRSMAETEEVTVFIPPGTTLPMGKNALTRLAEIRYHADNIAAADEFRQRILKTVRVIP